MRPDHSIIPTRQKVVVPPRPKFSTKRRLAIFMAHGGRCGICGLKIHGDEYDIEHRIARAISANDHDDNLYPAHRGCHAAKTSVDRKDIAKAQRLAGETCNGEPARKLQGRGFVSVSRGFDGRVKLTKKAMRAQAANDASLVGIAPSQLVEDDGHSSGLNGLGLGQLAHQHFSSPEVIDAPGISVGASSVATEDHGDPTRRVGLRSTENRRLGSNG